MALSTYGELKTAIAQWMMDAGATITDAVASDIVTLSQSLLNTVLRCREMTTTADLTPASNVCTLPDDYAQMIRVVEKASLRRPLDPISAEQADETYASRPAGLGVHYMMIGNSITVLPLSSNDVEITYYQRIAAFSSETATDWLLTRYPHVYLCAGQLFAAEYLKDQNEFAKHARALATYVDQVSGQNSAAEIIGGFVYGSGMRP